MRHFASRFLCFHTHTGFGRAFSNIFFPCLPAHCPSFLHPALNDEASCVASLRKPSPSESLGFCVPLSPETTYPKVKLSDTNAIICPSDLFYDRLENVPMIGGWDSVPRIPK